jgi:hypothetical protein
MKKKQTNIPSPPLTGWNDGLCQDYSKGLANWFSTRLSAKDDLRRALIKPKETK